MTVQSSLDEQDVQEIKTTHESEQIACQNCAGQVEHNIGEQKFVCISCGTEIIIEPDKEEVQEYNFDYYRNLALNSVVDESIKIVVCSSCGSKVYFDENDIATSCPMCRSSQILSTEDASGIPPEGIVAFKIERHEAQAKFRKWIKSVWFAPNQLKKAYAEGVLEGIYVPFWTYDTYAHANYAGYGGHTHTRRVTNSEGKSKRETYTLWYKTNGHVANTFDDIQICACTGTTKDIINDVLPYNSISNTKPYAHEYLSGYKAERYSIDVEQGFETAKLHVRSDLIYRAKNDIYAKGYDKANVCSCNVTCENVTCKHLLLPAWTAAYGYKDKIYHYVINGETGLVAGKYPLSWIKITLFAISVAAIASGLAYV